MGNFYRGKDFRSEQVSNAELSLLVELQNRGLNVNMNTQVPMRFNVEEDGVEGAFIDYLWIIEDGLLAVYLDGNEIHGRRVQSRRDNLIDIAFEKRSIRVKRFGYYPPLTKTRKKEIADEIEKEIRT